MLLLLFSTGFFYLNPHRNQDLATARAQHPPTFLRHAPERYGVHVERTYAPMGVPEGEVCSVLSLVLKNCLSAV